MPLHDSQLARDTLRCVWHLASHRSENESTTRAESRRANLVCVCVAFPFHWRRIASRTFGDESALIRRSYLRRSCGSLPHASGGVPTNGSDHGEPRQRGLAGTCCGVDEVGEGARRRRAALTPGSGPIGMMGDFGAACGNARCVGCFEHLTCRQCKLSIPVG